MKYAYVTLTTTMLLAFALTACAQDAAVGVSPPNCVTFQMPADGWISIAINDASGRRVRNLGGELQFTRGTHHIEWDGCDDNGKRMPPGQYQWIGLRRDAVHAVYRGAFQHGDPPWLYGTTGGWTADHSSAETVVTVGDRVLLGSNEAEWGHGLIASDLDGKKLWGVRWLTGRAWCGAQSLAAIGDRVFANSYLEQNRIWEINPTTGKNWMVFEPKNLPKDQTNTESWHANMTAPGLRIIGARTPGDDAPAGELYVADLLGKDPRVYVFTPGPVGQPLKLDRVLPVRPWSLAFLSDGRCVVAMDHSLAMMDVKTGRTTPLTTEGLSAPWCLAVDAQDRIYVSDQGDTGIHRFLPDGQLKARYLRLKDPSSQQVKIFDSAGKHLATLGRTGGQGVGPIDPTSFFMPAGLAIDKRGHLWITELTGSPKRVSVWRIPDDLSKDQPQLAQQFFGPTIYGGGAAMIDPSRPWRLMDTTYGVIFDVNLATGESKAVDLPWRAYDVWKDHGYRPQLPFTGRPGVVIPLDGRMFTACQGGYMHGDDAHWQPDSFSASGAVMIGEYRKDVFVPHAAIGNIRMWLRARELNSRRSEQWLPTIILDAARQWPNWPEIAGKMGMAPDAGDVPHTEHVRGSAVWIANPWPKEISGFIWVDADGDSKIDADEITFHPMGDADQITLDDQLNAYFSVNTQHNDSHIGTWKLQRTGFNAVGAPIYTWSALSKISDNAIDIRQVGRDGSMLAAAALYGPDGTLQWAYPSSRKGIRDLGSSNADVLKPGHIFRVNAMQGVVAGPNELGDLFLLHSIDGMDYLMTRRDGLFIATLFRPYAFADGWDSIPQAKPGILLDQYSLQDECFNAHFVQAQADGQGFEKGHYYLLGLGRSAVVEVTGLENVHRLSGGEITLTDGQGLYGQSRQYDPTDTAPRLSTIMTHPPLAAVPNIPGTELFRGQPATWATAKVLVGYDDHALHFKWQVGDATPFINKEQDWGMAYSSGDSCDIQIKSPKLGRSRYIVTMNDGKPAVVRFLYDAPDQGRSRTYRTEVGQTIVPDVQKLDIAPAVRQISDGYIVQFSIPWSVLGFDAPKAGEEIPLELGQFYSNTTGTRTMSRQYYFSGRNEMVADIANEARATDNWGLLILE